MTNMLGRFGHIRGRVGHAQSKSFEPVEIIFRFEDMPVALQQDCMSATLSQQGCAPLGSSLAGLVRAEKACGVFWDTLPGPAVETLRKLKYALLPDGNRLENYYNSHGQLIGVLYPDGVKMQYIYNKQGNPSAAFSSDGIDIAFHCDDAGRIIKSRYSNKDEFIYAWDLAGNLEQITYPDLTIAKYEWDGNNSLKNMIYRSDTVMEMRFHRNTLGQLRGISFDTGTDYEFPDGNALIKYEFRWQTDKTGKVERLVTPFGIWFFDDTERVRLGIGLGGEVKIYRYGKVGKLGSVWSAVGRTSLERSSDGRVMGIIDPFGFRTLRYSDPSRAIVYSIDPSGISAERYDQNQRLCNRVMQTGVRTLFNYDRKGRLSSIYHGLQGTTRLTYDSNNRLRRLVGSQGVDIDFKYGRDGGRMEGVTCRGPVPTALEVAFLVVESMFLSVEDSFLRFGIGEGV